MARNDASKAPTKTCLEDGTPGAETARCGVTCVYVTSHCRRANTSSTIERLTLSHNILSAHSTHTDTMFGLTRLTCRNGSVEWPTV
ncbi:Hypothetical protein NTJ_03276 [Nesidiocoris tenuis]|uniref:Uncharacterized protein n=1 Tax=Nesidiocoris tenuis TaxID=355587 RepID=A0ABN7AHV6_9HEMI|nr:Hypothetical protein NTJ_03276 [Nesidiocoris tenuis]